MLRALSGPPHGTFDLSERTVAPPRALPRISHCLVRKVAERKFPEFIEFSSRVFSRIFLRIFFEDFSCLFRGKRRPEKFSKANTKKMFTIFLESRQSNHLAWAAPLKNSVDVLGGWGGGSGKDLGRKEVQARGKVLFQIRRKGVRRGGGITRGILEDHYHPHRNNYKRKNKKINQDLGFLSAKLRKRKKISGILIYFVIVACCCGLWRAQHDHYESKCERKSGEFVWLSITKAKAK